MEIDLRTLNDLSQEWYGRFFHELNEDEKDIIRDIYYKQFI